MPLTLHLGNALVSALGECPWVGMPWGMPLVRRENGLDLALGDDALVHALGGCPWEWDALGGALGRSWVWPWQ